MKRFIFLLMVMLMGITSKVYSENVYEIITFSDANVKATCVANWDFNGDGELMLFEAAAVTELGDAFKKDYNIKRFNELKYFTGLKSIDESAFSECFRLTSITIPNSVTSIGDNAFESCRGLTSITIPNSVTSIGWYAFRYCSGLTSVTIGNSVTSIGWYAFSGCSGLTSITIPNSVTSIGAWAFYGCSGLTSVTIPNGVTSIGVSAFQGCSSLTSVTIPGSVTSIGEEAFYNCSGLTSVTIQNGVTRIGGNAFYNCSGLTSVTIPNSVTSIGDWAFYGCSGLTSLTIGNSVTSIGLSAFNGCSSLTSVTIPESMTSIGKSAFEGCSSLTSVTVKWKTPLNIRSSPFDGVYANATLYLPVGCKSAYASANYWKDFNEMVEMVDVLRNGNLEGEDVSCFYVKDVLRGNNGGDPVPLTIADNKGNDGSRGFEIQSANNPSEVWDTQFFIRLPWSLPAGTRYHISFDYKASQNAFSTTQIHTEPGDYIHWEGIGHQYYTTQWQHFDYIGTISTEQSPSDRPMQTIAFNLAETSTATSYYFDNIAFEVDNDYYIIPFADANVKALCVANWDASGDGELSEAEASLVKDLGTVFQSNTSIKSLYELSFFKSLNTISDNAFNGCSSLTSVTIPNWVTRIGNDAFHDCSGLTSFTIPNSVTSIGNGTFYRCSGLPSVTIPNSVTSIGYWAFYGCTGISSIVIPANVTYIGGGVFAGCVGLTSMTVEAENTTFDSRDGCNAIIQTSTNKLISGCKNTTIPEGVTSIEDWAFNGFGNLTSIVLPNSLTTIGEGAFSWCWGLPSITIPASVTSIGNGAFGDCGSLASVVVEASKPVTINSDVFTNRANATLYVPKGSKGAYTAAIYWKEFKVIKEYPDRDVNQDGETDVVDVVDIARYVVGTPATTFDVFLADLNSDKKVNVADAVVLVNDIAGNTNWSRGMRTPRSEYNDALALAENNDHSLSLQLEGDGRYTAFQFDLYLPEDVHVTQMQLNSLRRQKHQLLYNKVREGQWRVVALSTSNHEFEGVAGELLNITLDGFATDNVRVDNIHFVTAQGTDVTFEAIGLSKNGTVTGVDYVSSEADGSQSVYSLSGQRLNAPRKGLNIIGGKKIIIK